MKSLQLTALAPLALLLIIPLAVSAQSPSFSESAPTPARTGLLTERLSPKELQRWQAIEQLVFAQDAHGQHLHPTLRGLWEWVETSGHTVYVEFAKPSNFATSTAGTFLLEKLDPRGETHAGLIRLNLSNIDLAYVGPEAAHPNGLIPFAGLNKEERYAEVLGHELAHAADILTSLERVQKVEVMVEQTNELLLLHRAKQPKEPITPEMSQRLNRRDSLLRELERRAETMEAAVWKELAASKSAREKASAVAVK